MNRRMLCGIAAMTILLTGTACGKQTEQLQPEGEQPVTEALTEAVTEEETLETEAETEAVTEAVTEAATEEATEEATEAETEAETAAPTQAPTEKPKDNEPPAPTEKEEPVFKTDDALTFVFGNQPIRLGDNAKGFVDAVAPVSSEAAPSCLGSGEDINYYYDDFTLFVWNENGNYLTYGIDLMGMGVTTSRGVQVGSTLNDVIAAYGNDFTQEADDYIYTYDDCTLRFTVLDNEVHYISYNKEIS